MKTRNQLIVGSLFALAALPLAINQAYAGAGWGDSFDITGAPIKVPTYYANSPSGLRPDPLGGAALIDTGTALRKFVDTLPGLGATAANNLGQYIPVAVPEKWVNGNGVTTNDDYYELAVVEYTEKMHTDLVKATRLRGYVQLSTAKTPGKHIALAYPDGTPILDAKGVQVYAVDNPHYMGPLINATRGVAIRVKLSNYLPAGAAGNLFIPVDHTLPGAGLGPDGITMYTENRALLHWHGGDTPWISDGTPHQWFAPAGETAAYAAGMGKGASNANVSDMPDPGIGSTTYYWPNNLSGRLMFYHDHSFGLTRLNMYAGEAAGYLVSDPVEQGLVTSGVIPATQIPLIIQDKTFVPKDIAQQDAKWDTTHWGQEGDLWFPHVYETNQDPSSVDGTNPVGRWDWGPWFWPVFPAQYSLPTGVYGDVSTTPEAYMDTPLVNGTAYPSVTVDPKAYRFRILNASNDRFFNLGLYLADPTLPASDPGYGKEVKMVAAGIPADPVLAAAWPATWPTDGRTGGVPDPATVGPAIIQLGNEGGLLPNVAVIPSQPVSYEQNRRSITVLNVLNSGLYMGPAERADVVIDFSQYAGKTLILYNDGPAPDPAFDPRIDYFTGDGDQTSTGGAGNTLPGYGPNTRTIMQIKVNAVAAAPAFNVAALQSSLPVAYAASQNAPVIPESAYNAAFGTANPDNYARISTGSINQPNMSWTPAGVQTITGITLIGGGTGYTSAPTVNIIGGGGSGATATATVDPVTRMLTGITLTSPGTGYTSLPSITFSGGGGIGATATVTTSSTISLPVLSKAIQELFDPVYGRMNATLGVELPYTSSTIQTTIPLGYVDPATETIADGETQIWKITHNGVDTHPVHFHLLNVQVINRVGWDGTVKPPAAYEVGWKETVKMNPLEDIVVAVRAKRPVAPFGLPQSSRPMDPAQPLGSTLGFMQINPTNNAPMTVANAIANYDNEYVWHCHILGHEENDFMRPFVFHPTVVVPDAPSNVTSNAIASGLITWTDPTPALGADAKGVLTLGNPKNEIGFKVLRAIGTAAFAEIGRAPANTTSWTDAGRTAGKTYAYKVIAYNAMGDSVASNKFSVKIVSTPPSVTLSPVGPLTFAAQPLGTTSTAQPVTLTNTGAAPLPASSITFGGTNPGQFAQTNTCGASLAAGASCTVNVVFAPTVTGAKTASLTVTGSTQSVTLNGTAIPSVTFTPGTLAFGNQIAGTTSVAQPVTLTNTGTAALPASSITLGGTNSAQFAQTNTCGTSLAAGASCTVNVVFAPTVTGAKTASLTVTGSKQSVTLSGTAIPSVTLTPGSLAFGNQAVGTTSVAQPVTLTNTGTVALSASSIILGGTNSAQFAQTNTCGTSLAGGASCTVNVVFKPTVTGAKTASLTVTGSTQTVSLSGKGQ